MKARLFMLLLLVPSLSFSMEESNKRKRSAITDKQELLPSHDQREFALTSEEPDSKRPCLEPSNHFDKLPVELIDTIFEHVIGDNQIL